MKQKFIIVLPFLVLVSLVVAIFGKTIHFDYVWFDDDQQVSKNFGFIKDISNIPYAFLNDATLSQGKYSNYYRPMLNVSLILDAQICGKNPGCFHMQQIVLHLVFILLLYYFLRILNIQKLIALLAVFVFAFHPAVSSNVGLITGKTDLLLAVFFIASLVSFIKWLDNKNKLLLALHILLFNLAIYSKESGFLIIPILFAYIFTFRPEIKIKKVVPIPLIAWTISGVIWLILRQNALKLNTTSLSDQIQLSNIKGILVYIERILPIKLSSFPTFQDINIVWAIITISIILLTLILIKQKRRQLLFGCIWFLMIAVLSLVQPETKMETVFYEQRFYLALSGIFILFAQVLNHYYSKKTKDAILLAGVCICIVFALATFNRLNIYQNPFTFWSQATIDSPRSAEAKVGLGNAEYYFKGNAISAIKEYSNALDIDSEAPFAHSNLGVVYLEQGEYEKAKEALLAELRIRDLDDAWLQLGRVYYSERDLIKALYAWQKAYAISPNYLPVNINLALVYADMNRFEDAKYYYKQALALGEAEEGDRKYLEYLKFLENY